MSRISKRVRSSTSRQAEGQALRLSEVLGGGWRPNIWHGGDHLAPEDAWCWEIHRGAAKIMHMDSGKYRVCIDLEHSQIGLLPNIMIDDPCPREGLRRAMAKLDRSIMILQGVRNAIGGPR